MPWNLTWIGYKVLLFKNKFLSNAWNLTKGFVILILTHHYSICRLYNFFNKEQNTVIFIFFPKVTSPALRMDLVIKTSVSMGKIGSKTNTKLEVGP